MKTRILSLVLCVLMLVSMVPVSVSAATINSTDPYTKNMVWNDGDIVENITISGNVTVTVNGTVTVAGQITLDSAAGYNVTFKAGTANAMLIRDPSYTGTMIYATGAGNVVNFNGITLDGGAVWTGETYQTLGRGNVNTGIAATAALLNLQSAKAVFTNAVLQNHATAAGASKAAAIYARSNAEIVFADSTIRNNYSGDTYYKGGVLFIREGATVQITGSSLYGNEGAVGGVIGMSSSGAYDPVIKATNSKFYNNYAPSGAVFYVQDNSDNGKGELTLINCELYGNGSNKGLIYSHAYGTPVYIADSKIHDNSCAVFDYNQKNPNFYVSGNTVITNTEIVKPLIINGALGSDANIQISAASAAKLMQDFGYVASDAEYLVWVPNSGAWVYRKLDTPYTITTADLTKIHISGYTSLVKTDVSADGVYDLVPFNGTPTEVKLTLMDPYNQSFVYQTVYAEIACLPVCEFDHDGMLFNGWIDAQGTPVTKQNFTAPASFIVQWKLEAPVVTLQRINTDIDPYSNTLLATVTNQYAGITYTYQWYKDDVIIDGAVSAEYTITASATYKCVVTASADGCEDVSGYKSGTASLRVVPVAEFNGVQYSTIQDALEAVIQNGKVGTIKVLRDHEVDVNVLQYNLYPIVINGSKVTLDLNGKTVTFDYSKKTISTDTWAAIGIHNGGVLTIVDSSDAQTGTLYNKGAIANSPRIVWVTSKSSLVIEGGRFISEQGDTMFYTSNSNAEIPTTLYVKGGYFEHTILTDGGTWDYFNQQDGYQKQIIELTGGTFKHDPRIGRQNSWEVTIPDNYTVVENSDGTWTVKKIVSVTFNVSEENATIVVKTASGSAVTANGDGSYSLYAGDAYTYTVSKEGYLTKTAALSLEESGTIQVTLTKEHKHDISAEWTTDESSHWHACSGCDEKFDLAGHTYEDGVCNVCGAEDANYVAPVKKPAIDATLFALAARYAQRFDVLVSAENATVTGDMTIKYKRTGTVDIAVAEGYQLVDVIANGQSLGAVTSVTFKKVMAPQTLVVVTEPIPTEEPAVETPAN